MLGVAVSSSVAYMDQVSPPEYNLPWGSTENFTLRTPTSKTYNLPDGTRKIIIRRDTVSNGAPLMVEETTPFDIAAGGDDGLTIANDPAYPPPCIAIDDTDITLGALKTWTVVVD